LLFTFSKDLLVAADETTLATGIALRKLFMLDKAQVLNDLRIPPANRLKALKDDRKGQHSIRINDQW
jgi:proteic killer suppression protein